METQLFYRVVIIMFCLLVKGLNTMAQNTGDSNSRIVREAEQAMEHARRERTINPEAYVRSILNLADTYYLNQDYALARMYYGEYVLQASAKGLYDFDNAGDIDILKQIGLSSFYLGDYDDCIERFRGYLGQVQAIGNLPQQEVLGYCWMTECYIEKKEFFNAHIGVEKIKELCEMYNLKDSYSLLLSKYVEAHLKALTAPRDAINLITDLPIDGIEDSIEGYKLVIAIYKLWGTCTMQLSAYPLAADLFQRSIKLMEESGITKGVDYFDTCFNLMLVQAISTGQGENLIPIISKLNDIVIARVHDNFPRMTEKQRVAYWERFNEWLTFYLPRLASNQANPSVLSEAYNGILMAKGLLLRSAISIQDYIAHSGNEELEEIQEQIQYLKRKIQYWQNSERDEAGQEIFNAQTNMDRLQQRIYIATRNVDVMSDVYINIDSITNNLRSGDVAIEFLGLNRDLESPDSSTVRVKDYIALILKPEYKHPHIVKLCNSLSLPQNPNDLTKLYKTIWKPLECELQSVNRVFFSLDAELHKLPVEYSLSEAGQFMSDMFSMYRLSSTRQLAIKKKSQNENNDACLFGNVDYDQSVGSRAQPTVANVQALSHALKDTDCPNKQRGASDFQSQTFAGLTYSKQEIYSVASLCQSNRTKTQLFEGSNATEEIFKSMNGHSPKMLLLSTHGYFVPQESSGIYQMNIPRDKDGAEELSIEDESLSRSGLVLAGANQYLLGEASANQEDGFITARELSRMNLDNTDLVVLSACETGMGETSSEGVIGLQRGFKRAGANSLVMSLWKVDDYATSLLMEHFFESYFKSHSKQKAMSETVHYLRTIDNGRWSAPQYWAAFILLDALD